jgi:hypothetical protein
MADSGVAEKLRWQEARRRVDDDNFSRALHEENVPYTQRDVQSAGSRCSCGFGSGVTFRFRLVDPDVNAYGGVAAVRRRRLEEVVRLERQSRL